MNKNLTKQAGFTIIEVLFVIVNLSIIGGIAYVVCHFVSKFW